MCFERVVAKTRAVNGNDENIKEKEDDGSMGSDPQTIHCTNPH